MKMKHIEIEHKFVVPSNFDLPTLRRKLKRLGAGTGHKIDVRDKYYAFKSLPERIFRHRFDREIQHLTIKTPGHGSDARVEVNLHLDQSFGTQRDSVEAFLSHLGAYRCLEVRKRVEAFDLPGCEVVYYEARAGARIVRCVEFEATRKSTIRQSRSLIEKYEILCGFDPKKRELRSLFEMLVVPQLRTYTKVSRKK